MSTQHSNYVILDYLESLLIWIQTRLRKPTLRAMNQRLRVEHLTIWLLNCSLMKVFTVSNLIFGHLVVYCMRWPLESPHLQLKVFKI